jgi:hypothetical protein
MKKPLLMFALGLLFTLNGFSVPKLSSYPSAPATIFLDFDGHYVSGTIWNGGNPISCAAANMNDAQITEAFNRVAEDYRPFNVNVTTDSTVFLAAPLAHRVRVIVTATTWTSGVGGISYVGSFNWGDDTPAFVFSEALGNSPKMVGECCSHESGHTVGLSHQSKYDPSDCSNYTEEYNSGTGGGQTGWAPIMGNSYYKNMSSWNYGPTPYTCSSIQDNLSIISTQNGFTYRTDDFGETLNSSTNTLTASNFTRNGIISTNTDKDAFRFILSQNSAFHLSVIPFNVGADYIGADVDIRVTLYNSSSVAIRTYDPTATMSVTIDTSLNAGTYYLKVDGGGSITPYGSLGSYTLTGASGALPIHDVALTGNVDNNKHNLSWNIIADEPIKTIVVESSVDGNNFAPLTTVASSATKFAYQPYQNTMIYYRLKVTSVVFQTVYSNTIVLKAASKGDRSFSVSTLVQSDISVNAGENYQYRISDMNGRQIASGNGTRGVNKINISNQPGGMYIIQLVGNNSQQTERIIKQ